MALSNYTELQAAVATELNRSGDSIVTDVIPDFVKRAEVKINRRARLREMETLAYVTYSTTTRFVELPDGTDVNGVRVGPYVELLNLRIKKASEDDTKYKEVEFIDSEFIHEYYEDPADGEGFKYTLRKSVEMNRLPLTDHVLMMHYLKAWDIAGDSTNWLLTNYPDCYLYGALSEAEGFIRRDERIALWKQLFEESLVELNRLSERGRDEDRLQLSTAEISNMSERSGFDILKG